MKALKRASGATDPMKLGVPPLDVRLPFLSRIVARSKTEPPAVTTSGDCFTRSSTDGGTTGCVPSEFSNVFLAVIDASAPLFDAVKILSKPLLIESVKMYVPAISVVPSTTATAVRTNRSLRAKSPRRAIRVMPRPS